MRKMTLRLRALVGGAALAGLLPTLLVAVLAALPYARRSPGLHVMLVTVVALTAALAAYFVVCRFRLSRSLSDLVLAGSLGVLALTNLLLGAVPIALAEEPGRLTTWSFLAGHLLGAALFAASAVAPDRKVELSRRELTAVWLAYAAALATVSGAAAAFASSLPLGIDPARSPGELSRLQLTGHLAVHFVQALALVLFLIAVRGFYRRALRTGDALAPWLAAAATLGAFSALNYVLFPSLYSEWVYAGDLILAWFYVVVVGGAAREIGNYWDGLAARTVFEERRRIARELHDGVAQELAFVVVETRRVAGGSTDASALERISLAAERALDESRWAIAALTGPPDVTLGDALAGLADEVAVRLGVVLDFDLQPDIQVSSFTRQTLVRIVRDAITDAARGRHATRAKITLTNGHGLHLLITDDGDDSDRAAGADGDAHRALATLEERAHQLGGELTVVSLTQGGRSIEVVVP
jgi:signal transduction histidine kinase